tara:strand:- start:1239 stop:1937 length:699 start_codon:yes stop_codon:yes gene_type:complete
MQLGQSFVIRNRIPAFKLTDLTRLDVWLKRNTGIAQAGGKLSAWTDQSGNSNNAIQPTSGNQPSVSANGTVTFDGVDDLLGLETQLNLGVFTICIAMNPDETVTLENESPLGKGGNDVIKLYRGQDDERIALKANGVQSEINPMSQAFPTAQFLLTCQRDAAGLFTVRFNGTQVGGVASAVTNLYDITQIGSGGIANSQFSGDLNEIAIFSTVLSLSDLQKAEADIINRNNI